MKRDRQGIVDNIPFLQENILHSNPIKTTRNDGMVFKNVSVKSGDLTFSRNPMPDTENLPVNTCISTPSSSRTNSHTTSLSIEQTTFQNQVTHSLKSQLGFTNPLQVTNTHRKPIPGLGYPMQVKSTSIPTDVSTYPTGQLPKPISPYIYPQQTIASTVTQVYPPVYQPKVRVPLVYPSPTMLFTGEQPKVNSISTVGSVLINTKPQVIMDPQPGLFGPRYPAAYSYSASNASFPTPLVYPSDETKGVINKQVSSRFI